MRRPAVVVALVVGLVGVALLTACRHSVNFYASAKGNKGGPQTYVNLDDSSGTCVATPGVGTLGGKWKAKLTWNVKNNCATAQYIRIWHYQEYENSDAPDPTKLKDIDTNIIDPTPKDSKKFDPGEGDTIDAHIKKDNTGGGKDKLYKYWICVGTSTGPTTNCLDPDVDIWP